MDLPAIPSTLGPASGTVVSRGTATAGPTRDVRHRVAASVPQGQGLQGLWSRLRAGLTTGASAGSGDDPRVLDVDERLLSYWAG